MNGSIENNNEEIENFLASLEEFSPTVRLVANNGVTCLREEIGEDFQLFLRWGDLETVAFVGKWLIFSILRFQMK